LLSAGEDDDGDLAAADDADDDDGDGDDGDDDDDNDDDNGDDDDDNDDDNGDDDDAEDDGDASNPVMMAGAGAAEDDGDVAGRGFPLPLMGGLVPLHTRPSMVGGVGGNCCAGGDDDDDNDEEVEDDDGDAEDDGGVAGPAFPLPLLDMLCPCTAVHRQRAPLPLFFPPLLPCTVREVSARHKQKATKHWRFKL
jgi:hypothetical protein